MSPQDWTELLTSASRASDGGESDAAGEDSALPTAREVLAAIEASTECIDAPGDLAAPLPRGSGPAAATADVAAATTLPPASATTSILNELLESGCGHRLPEQQQQQSSKTVPTHQPSSEDLVRAKYWDKQIAEGNLSMLPEITIMHVNIMAWGESGLGKTVGAWSGAGGVRLAGLPGWQREGNLVRGCGSHRCIFEAAV